MEPVVMRLMTAHKILIGTAFVLFALFTLSRAADIPQGVRSLPMAALGLAMSLALAAYFRSLKGR